MVEEAGAVEAAGAEEATDVATTGTGSLEDFRALLLRRRADEARLTRLRLRLPTRVCTYIAQNTAQ